MKKTKKQPFSAHQMMPGQPPYVESELGKLNNMVRDAVMAEVYYTVDELEEFANRHCQLSHNGAQKR